MKRFLVTWCGTPRATAELYRSISALSTVGADADAKSAEGAVWERESLVRSEVVTARVG